MYSFLLNRYFELTYIPFLLPISVSAILKNFSLIILKIISIQLCFYEHLPINLRPGFNARTKVGITGIYIVVICGSRTPVVDRPGGLIDNHHVSIV